MLIEFKEKVLHGGHLEREEALLLCEVDLEELCVCADEIRQHFCGNSFDLCAIINGKSGRCTEDCKYCAQSAHHPAHITSYPLLDKAQLLEDALHHSQKGVLRYSIVTSGRTLDTKSLQHLCESFRSIQAHCAISLCASHGLLTYEQLVMLKKAGVTRYHNNLETSRRYFPQICTTHTYEDKIETIKAAQRAGLTVCSGGIMGLGETMEDRIDMALTLRSLSVKSIPLNILNAIPGTPLAQLPRLTIQEIRRITAIYRFLLPDAALRLAGGRGLLPDKGRSIFRSGANAAITGDMLTTTGICIAEDLQLVHDLGYEVKRL